MFDFLTMVPAKYRKWIYLVAGLASLCMGVWRASDGHWDEFAWLLVSALVNGLSGRNVTEAPAVEAQAGGDSAAS